MLQTLQYHRNGFARKTVCYTLMIRVMSDSHFIFSGKTLMPGIRELCKITGPIHIDDVTIEEKPWGENNIAYRLHYDVDIDFGSVTSKAKVIWKGKDVSIYKMLYHHVFSQTRQNKTTFVQAIFHPPHDSEALWNDL